jgi:hypothetical protein
MPFSHHDPRRDSWPPTILRLRDDDEFPSPTETDIDANPFAYFLATPTALDDDDDIESLDLSAGIESDDNDPASPVREVSPSSLQRIPLDLDLDPNDASPRTPPLHPHRRFIAAPLLSLRDYTEAHLSRNKCRGPLLEDIDIYMDADIDNLPGQAVPRDESERERLVASTGSRGRGTIRLSPSGQNLRGRSKSLSAQRPHIWREPSPEVYTILEEDEGMKDVEGFDIPKIVLRRVSIPEEERELEDLPVLAKGEGVDRKGKVKKRVRWAVPERSG